MLKLKNINVSFGHKQVLRNLSCTVGKGDFIVIVGTNGAGKSTLFDTIAGRVLPQSGSIIMNNQNITQVKEQQRAGMVTRIFQNTRLNSVGSMTVAENLAIAHYSRRSARLVPGTHALPREQAQQVIEQFGISPSLLDKKMNQLSGGQRQLIAFAMCTQKIPQLLLLDEPTAALDPQAATTLLTHAAKFIKKHTVTTLLITHDPYIALSLGNKIWMLDQGIITHEFTAQEKQDLNPDKLIGQIDYQKLAGL